MSDAKKTEAEAVAEIAEKAEAKLFAMTDHLGDIRMTVLLNSPQGQKLQSVKGLLDEYRDAPERARGTAAMQTLPSFIDHVCRNKNCDSAVFADRSDVAKPKMIAVIDYNHPSIGSRVRPAFGVHRISYDFPLSDEWKAWSEHNGVVMQQAKFAEFLENRIVDVCEPHEAEVRTHNFATKIGCALATPTKLLELSRGLSLRVGQVVKNRVSLGTGETDMTFATEHQDERGAPLKVPGAFLIGIPVFRSGERYQLAARLRYRIKEGALVWLYELAQVELLFDAAFEGACEEVKSGTGLPLFHGLPEVG